MPLFIQRITGIAGIIAVIALVFVFAQPERALSQGTAGPITGYAWSDTIGWLSLNGSNYGFTIASDGTLSGYAWSDTVGWVSAQTSDLTGCPTAPCTARVSGGAFAGWIRALGGGTSGSGGWDGFISLSGSGYGVSQVGASLSGYAWGSTNVGWLDFSGAVTTFAACSATQGNFCTGQISQNRNSQCVVTTLQDCSALAPGWFCGDTGVCVAPAAPAFAASGELQINPRLIIPGQSVSISWEVANAISCSVTEDNPLITDVWSGISSSASVCTHSGAACVSSPLSEATTYTLQCTGNGGTLTDSVTVSFRPGWQEI